MRSSEEARRRNKILTIQKKHGDGTNLMSCRAPFPAHSIFGVVTFLISALEFI